MANKNILPDWYPAEIHKRRLSLKEWTEELEARTFVFELLVNPEINLEQLSKGFISSQFIDFVIDGKRNDHHIPPQTVPLFNIPPVGTNTKGKLIYNFTPSEYGRGLMFPLMVNFDYDDDFLVEDFKNWLAYTKRLIKSGDVQKLFFDQMFDGQKMSSTFKPSKNSKGEKRYIDAQTHDWFRYKVLDWIDLKLWAILMKVEYDNAFLKNLFFPGDNKEGSKTDLRTTINWSYELLNRLTYDQISASIYTQSKTKQST